MGGQESDVEDGREVEWETSERISMGERESQRSLGRVAEVRECGKWTGN